MYHVFEDWLTTPYQTLMMMASTTLLDYVIATWKSLRS